MHYAALISIENMHVAVIFLQVAPAFLERGLMPSRHYVAYQLCGCSGSSSGLA